MQFSTSSGINNGLAILVVGAAWLMGKINETTAIPVLLVLAGIIQIPAALAARHGRQALEQLPGDTERPQGGGPGPCAVALLVASGTLLPLLQAAATTLGLGALIGHGLPL